MDRKEIYTTEFARNTFDYNEEGFLVWKERRGSLREGSRAGTFDERTKCWMINIKGVSVSARRLIWLWHGKIISENQILSPKNSNQEDDRLENLFLKDVIRKSPPNRILETDIELVKKNFRYDSETGFLYRLRGGSENQITADRVKFNKITYPKHRICFIRHHERKIGEGLFIDHINGDTSDNRICNLREATNAQNQMNSRRQRNRISNLPKGVYKATNKFYSNIKIKGKTIYLGMFDTIEEATLAYRNAAILHFGSYARFE